jgi:hypothetical protein
MKLKVILSLLILFTGLSMHTVAQDIPTLDQNICLVDAFQGYDLMAGIEDTTLPIQIDTVIAEGDCDSVTISIGMGGTGMTMPVMDVIRQDSCNISMSYGGAMGGTGTDTVINVCEPLNVSRPSQQSNLQIELSGMPNPFDDKVTITYQVYDEAKLDQMINLKIFTMDGTQIFSVPIAGTLGNFVWDGKDSYGNSAPPGTYQAVLQVKGLSKTVNLTKTK